MNILLFVPGKYSKKKKNVVWYVLSKSNFLKQSLMNANIKSRTNDMHHIDPSEYKACKCKSKHTDIANENEDKEEERNKNKIMKNNHKE